MNLNKTGLPKTIKTENEDENNKIFILVTGSDYSLPGKIGIKSINAIPLINKDEEGAIKEAKKIVREKYIKTGMNHDFSLKKGDRVIARIISPNLKEPGNLPICRICFKKGKIIDACFKEDLGGIIIYSCQNDRIKDESLKDLAARMSVRVLDLKEGREIFSDK